MEMKWEKKRERERERGERGMTREREEGREEAQGAPGAMFIAHEYIHRRESHERTPT